MPGTLVHRGTGTEDGEIRPFSPISQPSQRIKVGGDGWARCSISALAVAARADFLFDEAYTIEDIVVHSLATSIGATLQAQTAGGAANIGTALAATPIGALIRETNIQNGAIAAGGTLSFLGAVATASAEVHIKLRHT